MLSYRADIDTSCQKIFNTNCPVCLLHHIISVIIKLYKDLYMAYIYYNVSCNFNKYLESCENLKLHQFLTDDEDFNRKSIP